MAGPRVSDESGTSQPGNIGLGIVARQHHDAGSLLGCRGHLRGDSLGAGSLEQVFYQVTGDSSSFGRTEFLQRLESPKLGIDRRHRRGAQLEPARIVVRLEVAGVEPELLAMGKPPGRLGKELGSEMRRRMEKCYSASAHQPLEPAGTVEVRLHCGYIHRQLPGPLIPVNETERSAAVRQLGNGRGILDRSGGEEHVAGGDQGSAIVYRRLERLANVEVGAGVG